MAECTYDFTGPDGKPVRIQGKAEFKAYLANGGLEHFGIRSPGGDTKFSRSSQAMPDTIEVDGVERPTTNSTAHSPDRRRGAELLQVVRRVEGCG